MYFQLLFRYIKDFNKDRNYLFYELQSCGFELIKLKKYNNQYFLKNASIMLKEIINDNKSSTEFKKFIKNQYIF